MPKLLATAALVSIMLACPVYAAAKAKAAAPAASSWTQGDVQKFCNLRWQNKPKRYQSCLQRQAGKVGQPMAANMRASLAANQLPSKKKGGTNQFAPGNAAPALAPAPAR